MKARNGARLKRGDEETPLYEVHEMRHAGNPIQVCWDFEQFAHEDTPNIPEYKYKFANIPALTSEELTSAGVPQEIINEII